MLEPRITSSTLARVIEVGARFASLAKRLAVVAMTKLAAAPATSPEKRLRDPLVVDVFDMYVAARAEAGTHAPGTFEGHRTARGHIAQAFANVRASQLDPERIEDAQRLLRGHLRPSTVRNVLAHAASAWRWAARNGRKTGVTTRGKRRGGHGGLDQGCVVLPLLCALDLPSVSSVTNLLVHQLTRGNLVGPALSSVVVLTARACG